MVRGRRIRSCRRLSRQLDISDFNPKAAPPKTEAFWAIVDANRSPEDSELADAIDRLGQETIGEDGQPEIIRPKASPSTRSRWSPSGDFAAWIRDPKNRRAIPHRLEECGYTPVRNPECQGRPLEDQWPAESRLCPKQHDPRDQMDQAKPSPEPACQADSSSVKSVKSVVRHYPPEKTERRNGAVDDSARSLTPLTSLTGHDLTCAQCHAGTPDDPPTIKVRTVTLPSGCTTHCLRFWKGDHPQSQISKQEN